MSNSASGREKAGAGQATSLTNLRTEPASTLSSRFGSGGAPGVLRNVLTAAKRATHHTAQHRRRPRAGLASARGVKLASAVGLMLGQAPWILTEGTPLETPGQFEPKSAAGLRDNVL